MDKTNNPVISIVLLSLLRKAETQRCIQSIFAHTPCPFEIIVVDMGVSPEIVEWLQQLNSEKPNIIPIFNEHNIGTTKGRNQAIAAAKGEYVVFLDNDTEVTDGWIVPLIETAAASPQIAACGSKVISANGKVMNCPQFAKATFENGRVKTIGVEFTQNYDSGHPEVNKTEEVAWFPTTSLLIKKSVLDEIGGFDENIFLCEEDKDLCLRMGEAGFKTVYVPQSVVYHHHGKASADYSRIRNSMPILIKDVKYFEKKWDCKVFIRHSRTYLHKSGYDDPDIDKIKKFSFFNTILEEDLKLNELILTVTNRCNHHCGMCYYHELLNDDRAELTLDEYRKISASIQKLNILWISGGEPFLRKDLADICRIFVESNKVENIFIPTNGSNPERIAKATEQIVLENPEVKITIMFSLEGTEKEHDDIHQTPGAFRSVETSIRKLNFLRVKLFRRQGLHFTILLNSVVTSQNINLMIPLMEYAKNHLMIDSHSLSPMRGAGHDPAHRPPAGNLFSELYQNARPYFDFYAKRSRLSVEKISHFHEWMNRRYNLWCNLLDGGSLPFDCRAGTLIGVLEPDGGVRICESKPVAGNVRNYNYNFPKAWFSAKADKTRETKKGCSCTHACFLNISEKNG
jgi:GT2 family glycosyltransferase